MITAKEQRARLFQHIVESSALIFTCYFVLTDGVVQVRYGETAVVQFKASKRQGKFTFSFSFIFTFLTLRLWLVHFDAL